MNPLNTYGCSNPRPAMPMLEMWRPWPSVYVKAATASLGLRWVQQWLNNPRDCERQPDFCCIKMGVWAGEVGRECTPSVQFSSVQSLSRVRLFVTPWIAAHQASLSITNSQITKYRNRLILCHSFLTGNSPEKFHGKLKFMKMGSDILVMIRKCLKHLPKRRESRQFSTLVTH